jgi:tetratricopeptide (TPR) repeat protein
VYRTLSLAAVAGMECTFALLHAAGDLDEGALLDALDRALEARIVDEWQGGYIFRHPLFRAALYEHLSARRRASLHARLAMALEAQRPDEVEMLAYHYARTDRREKAVLYLERAGDRARAVYANEAAADYYRELVAHLDSLKRALEGAGAREKLGTVLVTMARYDEALAVLEQAATAFRAAGEWDRLGRVAALIGRVQSFGRQPAAGSAYLERVIDELEPRASPRALAALASALALTYFAGGRYAEQLAAAERAARFAHSSGEPGVLAEAEGRRGLALISLGRPAEARQVLEDAIPLAEATGDQFTLTAALNDLGAVYRRIGEFERHACCLERALEMAEQQADPSGIAYFLSALGSGDFYGGDWQSAHARLRRAEALGHAHPSWVTPYPLLGLGELYLGRGDWTAASQLLEECINLAEGYGDVQCLRDAGCLLAERDLLLGRPEQALARLDTLLTRAEHAHAEVADLLALRAWAFLAGGDLESAEQATGRSVRRAREAGNRFLLVGALRVQAMLLIRQHRWKEAAQAVEEGLALARAMSYPYAEARLLQVSAQLRAQQGDPASARDDLMAALAIFRRLGANAHAEQAAAALRHWRSKGYPSTPSA